MREAPATADHAQPVSNPVGSERDWGLGFDAQQPHPIVVHGDGGRELFRVTAERRFVWADDVDQQEAARVFAALVNGWLADSPIRDAAPQLLDSLLSVEWAGSDDGQDFPEQIDCCPNCGAPAFDVAAKPRGLLTLPNGRHYDFCELRNALDAALGVASPRIAHPVHSHDEEAARG